MIHAIIIRDRAIFRSITEKFATKKISLEDSLYEMYSYGNIRIVWEYDESIDKVLVKIIEGFNPDIIFFLSESYPVSDEKQGGDIILPNVFFPYDTELETMEIWKDPDLSLAHPIFLEHYELQGDYNFETFGLSVGGIHVSGVWNEKIEDFRIRLRLAYENDTFDNSLYSFVESAQSLSIINKIYPVAYIGTEDIDALSLNLWNIVRFVIGSIDPSVSDDEEGDDEKQEDEDGEEWVDGSENE